MWFEMERATLDWAPQARASFHSETILDANPEEVFDILADVDQWEVWFPEFESAEWLSDGEPGVGARRVIHMDIMSAREEFLAWEPGERFAFCLTEATLPLAKRLVEDYRLSPLAGGRCAFEWDVYYEPRTLLRPFTPLLRLNFGRMFQRATRSLSTYIRSQSVERAAS